MFVLKLNSPNKKKILDQVTELVMVTCRPPVS